MNRKEEKILERIDWIWKQLCISLILFVLGIMLLGWLISSQRGGTFMGDISNEWPGVSVLWISIWRIAPDV